MGKTSTKPLKTVGENTLRNAIPASCVIRSSYPHIQAITGLDTESPTLEWIS
jgi:hypothetical protein